MAYRWSTSTSYKSLLGGYRNDVITNCANRSWVVRKFLAMSCPFMHTHISTFHVCVRVRVCVRTCVRGFVFVSNSGLLPVKLAFWYAIPGENTIKTFMGMYACVRPCACACVHMFTRRAQVFARARWNTIMAALDTCSPMCPTHYGLSYVG